MPRFGIHHQHGAAARGKVCLPHHDLRGDAVCRKLYADDIRPECMLDPAPAADHYPEFAGSDDPDYHTMYVAEVERVLVAD